MWKRERKRRSHGVDAELLPALTYMAQLRSYIRFTHCTRTLLQHRIKDERHSMETTWPEQYSLPRSTYVPNNILPVLIYRKVLPVPVNSELAKQLCQGNGWEKRVSLRDERELASKAALNA